MNNNGTDPTGVLEDLAEFLKNFMEDLGIGLWGKHRPYAINREAQQGMTKAVKGVGEQMQDCLKEQDYASYYIMARQQKLLIAAHEVAMSKNWKREHQDLMQQEIMKAYDKGIDDLHKNDPNAKIAINDYNSVSSDAEKVALYESATKKSHSVFDKHLREGSVRLLDKIIAEDITRLAKAQSTVPLSPQEKHEMLENTREAERKMSVRSADNDAELEDTNQISGPGR